MTFCEWSLTNGRGVIERQRLHVVAERAGVPEPVRPEHLVVGEVERAAHALVAAGPGVVLVPVPAARLAPREVRHEWPPPPAHPGLRQPSPRQRRVPRRGVRHVLCFRTPPPQRGRPRSPLHGLVPLRDVAEPPHDLQPVALEVVVALQEHLLPPRAAALQQHVHERRLVVRLVEHLVLERGLEHGAPAAVVRGVGPHGGPRVHEVERPLTVPDEEHPRVEAGPGPGLEHKARPAVDDEVVAAVPAQGEAEVHIREHGVGVHPPHPLRLRVRHHGGADRRYLGPVPVHRRPEQRRVVQQLHAVESAVVGLVLQQPQQPGHHQDAFDAAGGDLRVRARPSGALLVPPRDGPVHGVRQRRVIVERAAAAAGTAAGAGVQGGRSLVVGVRLGERVGEREQQDGGHHGARGEEERVGEQRRLRSARRHP
uniref:Uncharacterized protein n=1 Tax=Setaria italica TaxID=4555 RepID=K3YSQ8_SETIT